MCLSHHQRIVGEPNGHPATQVNSSRDGEIDEISADRPGGGILTHSLGVAAGVEPTSARSRVEGRRCREICVSVPEGAVQSMVNTVLSTLKFPPQSGWSGPG